jgi:hypothetical protein
MQSANYIGFIEDGEALERLDTLRRDAYCLKFTIPAVILV